MQKSNTYARNFGRTAQKAQNALCFHYQICYDAKGLPERHVLAGQPDRFVLAGLPDRFVLAGQPKNNAAPRQPKPTYEELVARFGSAQRPLSRVEVSRSDPNPSDQYVTVAYTLLHAKGNTNMQVFDNLGRQIENRNLGEVYEGQQLIDTRKLANGVYFFQIVQDGEKLSDGKFVVTH